MAAAGRAPTAAAQAPPAAGPAAPIAARTAKTRICTSYLAESTKIFPQSVKCTYGAKCKFAHQDYTVVAKDDAQSAVDSAKGKLTDAQVLELKAFIEANCV